MATQADQILDFILRFPGRDDDEIARLLKIFPRQTVNMICRKFATTGEIRRAKNATGKIANYPAPIGSRDTKACIVEADVEGEVAPKQNRPTLNAEQLLGSGFKLCAQWRLTARRTLETDHPLPPEKGVYAFVGRGVALYVGVASMGLRKRLYFYAKPGVTQRTSQRLNAILIDELTKGESIEIYAATPPDLEWNGLPVSGVAGLEIGLIERFHLPWNIRSVREVDKTPRENVEGFSQQSGQPLTLHEAMAPHIGRPKK